MIRRAALLTVVVLAVGLAPTASGSSERSMPIRLGVGIGPINLGMTGQEVRRALGRPRAVIERRVVRGQPYIEFEYDYGAWKVGLLGRKGKRRVVLVGTMFGRHRTPEGIGVGSRDSRLARAYGRQLRKRECWDVPGAASGHRQRYLRHGNAETVFFLYEEWDCPYTGCSSSRYTYVGMIEIRMPPTTTCAF